MVNDMSGDAHVPVLLGPVLKGLRIDEDGVYVDGTFGRGGHSTAILERLGPNGRLIAIDRDPSVAAAASTLAGDPRFELIRGPYAHVDTYIRQRMLERKVDGFLLDLGVSSPQLDDAGRGFSFLRDGPLDMRMDPDSGQSAAELLAETSEVDLGKLLKRYGEETMAKRIARAIVTRRTESPIRTTKDLADIVLAAVPARLRERSHGQKRHPATKTFQAIRIAVNDELGQLHSALGASLRILKQGGRLCVIAFHSLEDRIVKRFIRENSREPDQYRGMPEVPAEFQPALAPIGKAVTASAAEIARNPRARSARLRIAERQ